MISDLPRSLGRAEAVLVGRVRALGANGMISAIRKTPRTEPLCLTFTGLEGDEHGHPQVHGGEEMALHHYAFDHYAHWRKRFPRAAPLNAPGAFGENLSTTGITERTLCVGDILKIGKATVQVSQGRQPCYVLNAWFEAPDAAREIQETRQTGWYYRVLEEGDIAPGDSIELRERLNPNWTIDEVQRILYADTLNRDALKLLRDLPALTERWKSIFDARLKTGKVEDWTSRLGG
ncbi:MAG: MOSC domain-containing protein [Synergistaceae bacterium]|jgi:MOSC domain-containing protein YiiM|nr:MOSC domain-containing protein [Synergistaceae bacterium]